MGDEALERRAAPAAGKAAGRAAGLKAAERPLTAVHDLAVLDLDGVVYVGSAAVPGAAAAIAAASAAGTHIAFVTNNAARTPREVAAHLRALGVAAEDRDVVTSAQAAARLVAAAVPPRSRVYVIGGEGLEAALRERDLEPVRVLDGVPESPPDAGPDGEGVGGAVVTGPVGIAAVVQGYGPQMPWRQVIDGAILVRAGLVWVASNTDLTFPTAHGLAPGNGALVRLVAEHAGRSPAVAGKPEPALFEETVDRVGGRRPIVVGDRLDTDIAGARRMGWDSLLVLSGVTGLTDLVAAPTGMRPSYIAPDLGGLGVPHPAPTRADGDLGPEWRLAGWTARVREGRLGVDGAGAPIDWWRVVAAAAWEHLDATGRVAVVGDVRAPG